MARQVNIVPHTHWDREWYKPYPLFRMQLVELVDLLLQNLEADPDYAHFQLDGQMAVVDDYLEIRPERRDDLVQLARSGRVTMGPWYTLPDEFLVSGETHIRNLALGMDKADEFGGLMDIGYLPDMFGHVAQMPQILAGFGFTDTVVWRGIPSAISAPAFDWEGLDGSRVRAEYLSDGYSNGARLPETGDALIAQLDAFVKGQGPLVGDPVLWMNGTDHQLPQTWLPRVVAEANDGGDEFRFTVTSMADHISQGERNGLPLWKGELRSGARTNLLMGTASCRVDVKQAASKVERSLERLAEPLAALWPPADGYPTAFLDHAWRDVIRNAAHDSICGCSHDEVNDAVLHRYAESTDIAEAITDRALIRILAESAQPAVVVNSTSRPRAATVSTVLPGEVPPPNTQQLSVRPARIRTDTLSRDAALAVVTRAALDDPKVSDITFDRQDNGDWVATVIADRKPKNIDLNAMREQLEAIRDDDTVQNVHLEVQRVDASQEVLLRTADVPGFGWRGLAPAELGEYAVRAEGSGLTNGLMTIAVDKATGTFSVNGIDGFGRIVDDGDEGDTYNWSPPKDDQVIQRPDAVNVHVSEAGPIRGRIEIRRTYRWPEEIVDHRRMGEVQTVVTTVVDLHAGEDLVRVRIQFENRSRDHRVRVHLPLPEPASTSVAECVFGTVTRGLDAEGGPNEVGLPTFPSHRFVVAGGLTVAHDGLTEYELVDIEGEGDDCRATELAITILRSVGIVSQGPMPMRAVPAGPPTLTPGAQLPGRRHADFVIHLGGRDPYAVADEALTPVLTARRPNAEFGDAEKAESRLTVTGVEVSALRRRSDGTLELRVVNPTDESAALSVTDGDGSAVAGRTTDLRGRDTGEPFTGEAVLGPWQFATYALDS